MEKIIQRIIKYRKQKGFTYENMAYELEISAAAYRKIEIGETKLTLERLFKLSLILDTSVIELLDLSAYHTSLNPNLSLGDKEIINQLLHSKDEQITLLKEMLNIKNNI